MTWVIWVHPVLDMFVMWNISLRWIDSDTNTMRYYNERLSERYLPQDIIQVGLLLYHAMHKARRMLHTVGQLTRSHFVACSIVQHFSTAVLSSLAFSARHIIAVRHSQARWVTIPNDMSSHVWVFDWCYSVTVELYCNCSEQLHLCID